MPKGSRPLGTENPIINPKNSRNTMAEIFAPAIDAFKECAAFFMFLAAAIAIGYAFYGVLFLVFGHKSELVRVIWYAITNTKTEKRNGRTVPIRNGEVSPNVA